MTLYLSLNSGTITDLTPPTQAAERSVGCPAKCALCIWRLTLGLVRPFTVQLYGITVHNGEYMDTISVNKFRDNLKSVIEQVISRHEPLKVTRRAGEAFVVLSAEDWEREQETLSVLQNRDLIQQIAASLETHKHGQGYKPTKEQMDEITGI